MSKTNEQIANLSTQIGNLTYVIEQLTDSLNKTDDFNNWSYADSFASIANSLVKANSLHKTELNIRGKQSLLNKDWFEENPYMKFEHSGQTKWQPITNEMATRLTKAKQTLNLPQEDVAFIDQMCSVDDGTVGQFKKINAIIYQLYNQKVA
jgi:hypothetical protein